MMMLNKVFSVVFQISSSKSRFSYHLLKLCNGFVVVFFAYILKMKWNLVLVLLVLIKTTCDEFVN